MLAILFIFLQIIPAYSQRGDFALFDARPVQSAQGIDTLIEGKKTVIKVDIASLFPEMPVPIRVSPYYEGYFTAGTD